MNAKHLFLVIILATPVIVTQPKSVVSKEGGTNIFLNCSAHDNGEGGVKYKWEKYHPSDDRWIRPAKRHRRIKLPILIFNVINEEDEGVYHCVATNDDGITVSDNATVTVYGELKYAGTK